MDWKNIVNLKNLKFKADDQYPHYRYEVAPQVSAQEMGAKKLGYNVSILPPGEFTCPYHFHHSEEELFLVLQGKAMLRQNGQFREIVEGDLIFFSADAQGAHQMYNHSDEPFKFFALSTNDPLDLCEYPDSKKVLVRRLRKIYQAGTEVDYFKDELDPSPQWPKEYLK
jgi:uncharacterized cupin superfamily protein